MSLFPSVTYPATLDNVCLFILYGNKVIPNKEKHCYTMFHYTSRGTFWIFFFRLRTVFIMTWRLCLQHDIGTLKHQKSQIKQRCWTVSGKENMCSNFCTSALKYLHHEINYKMETRKLSLSKCHSSIRQVTPNIWSLFL